MIPRFMPGDPISGMVARANVQQAEAAAAMRAHYENLFGFDQPVWQQYINFWGTLLRGDLGISIWAYPRPVSELLVAAVPYTLALLVPAIVLSNWAGNRYGAYAARRKWLYNTIMPIGHILIATAYMCVTLHLRRLLKVL